MQRQSNIIWKSVSCSPLQSLPCFDDSFDTNCVLPQLFPQPLDVGIHRPAYGQAIQFRHHNIQKCCVKFLLFNQRQRFHAVPGFEGVVTLAAEKVS